MEDYISVCHFKQFTQALVRKLKKKKLCLMWLTSMWSIWNWRNNILFKEEVCVLNDMIINIKIVSWLRHIIHNREKNMYNNVQLNKFPFRLSKMLLKLL